MLLHRTVKFAGIIGVYGPPPNAGISFHPQLRIYHLPPSTSCRASWGLLSSPRRAARRVCVPVPLPCAPAGAGGPIRREGLQTAVRRAPAGSSLLQTFVPRAGARL